MTEKKKSLLDKAIDALTDRDEKAAAEAAAEEEKKLAAEKIMAEAKAKAEAAAKAKAEAEAKAKAEAEAAAKAKAAEEAKAKILAEQQKNKEKLEKMLADQEKKKAEEAARKAAIVKHVWTNEDTYASLAFEHYGSIKEPYWRLIYEHNKDIIGDHPNHIKTGTEIEIPPLPDELKKK